MFRIDVATAAVSIPTPEVPGPKVDGFFQGGDPGSGTPATILTADWLNAVQEEICTVIDEAGLTLSKTDRGQLLEALNAIYLPIGSLSPVDDDFLEYITGAWATRTPTQAMAKLAALAPDGLVGSGGLAFASEPGSGLYRPGSGIVGLKANGTEVMRSTTALTTFNLPAVMQAVQADKVRKTGGVTTSQSTGAWVTLCDVQGVDATGLWIFTAYFGEQHGGACMVQVSLEYPTILEKWVDLAPGVDFRITGNDLQAAQLGASPTPIIWSAFRIGG